MTDDEFLARCGHPAALPSSTDTEAGIEAILACMVAAEPACVEMWQGYCPVETDDGEPFLWHVCVNDAGHGGGHVCLCGERHD